MQTRIKRVVLALVVACVAVPLAQAKASSCVNGVCTQTPVDCPAYPEQRTCALVYATNVGGSDPYAFFNVELHDSRVQARYVGESRGSISGTSLALSSWGVPGLTVSQFGPVPTSTFFAYLNPSVGLTPSGPSAWVPVAASPLAIGPVTVTATNPSRPNGVSISPAGADSESRSSIAIATSTVSTSATVWQGGWVRDDGVYYSVLAKVPSPVSGLPLSTCRGVGVDTDSAIPVYGMHC